MFEFHGWLTVDGALDAKGIIDVRLIELVASAGVGSGSICEVRLTSNELLVVQAHGLQNHRNEPLIRVFKEIAETWPESYGLLYVWDQEHKQLYNEFQVFRFARGSVEEMTDPFLSPCMPVIEPEYEGEDD